MLPSNFPWKITRNALATAALVLAAAGAAQAQAYANVTVGGAFAPGVYGQVSLGNNPPPPVLNMQPVIVGAPVYGVPPMYLHVAPDEYRDWGRHCGRYRACGHPVYFVQVDERNRWWEHHGEHLRGESYYRTPIARDYGHRDNRWEDRHDNRRDGREGREDRRHGDREDRRQ
jgi:hypothetical protein